MVKTLRESQEELSDLVERASRGEDVLITVNGEIKARLTKAPDASIGSSTLEVNGHQWVEELRELRRTTAGPDGPADTPQEFWDDLREDRA